MKDILVFSCPDGIATLILREVPFRGEGYILVRGVFGTLEGLLAECTGFCRAAGAERLFAAGEADFSGYPAAIRILGRSAPRQWRRCSRARANAACGRWRPGAQGRRCA